MQKKERQVKDFYKIKMVAKSFRKLFLWKLKREGKKINENKS